jgi:hypothetical protein
MGTSKVTSEGSEEEMEEDNESDAVAGSEKTVVAIEGMQLLPGHRKKFSKESMQEDKELEEEGKDDKEDDSQDPDYEEESWLTKNVNAAMKKLQSLSVNGDQDKGKDEKFGDGFDREESINPYSDDEGCKDFNGEDLSIHQEDLTLGDDFDTASEVSSGAFDATHSNKYEEPDNFKQLLWSVVGPSTGSMIVMPELLKDNLEADQAGLPADFNQILLTLLEFMILDAGEERKEQIKFIKKIMEDVKQLGQTNSLNKASRLEKGEGQLQEASKTQGTLPGAHKASPTEEVAIEPATMAGQDKEGAQSLSVAPTG